MQKIIRKLNETVYLDTDPNVVTSILMNLLFMEGRDNPPYFYFYQCQQCLQCRVGVFTLHNLVDDAVLNSHVLKRIYKKLPSDQLAIDLASLCW